MLKFVIDEDMPRSTARTLKAKGFEALDVRDCVPFSNLAESDFMGNLSILEPGRIRIRRKSV
ncbi:MAG: hypothetical protein D4R88_09030 [Methanosarcinales archaeon]|nr:MAG: hypothetical protein D4R88_09030 [Methanosarcinales archaeon]